MKFSEASESGLSGLLSNVGQALDNLSDSVDASLQDNSGGEESTLGVVLSLSNLVVALMLLKESDDALGALLALGFHG